MKNHLKKLLLLITIISSFLLFKININATKGDTEATIGTSSKGCDGKDSCWVSVNGSSGSLYGIRVTIVDGDGNMVSARSVDYLGESEFVDYINTKKSYYRCTNNNRNRLAYLNGTASCSWNTHDGSSISKLLSWLPNIYKSNNAADTIRNKIINMDQSSLESTFFNDLGYSVPASDIRKNHYLIIEPLTLVKLGSTHYYGTYYELAAKIVGKYEHVLTVTSIHMSLSIYAVGNPEIGGPGGYNASNGEYFNGKLKVANNSVHTFIDSKNRTHLHYDTFVNQSIGYGIGIYWLDSFKNIDPPTCDYNNSSHFKDSTSGPNGENCCQYVKNNLSSYGLNSVNKLYEKYPQCRSTCDYNNSSHFAGENSGPNGENCCQYVIDNLNTYGINKTQLFQKYPYCRSVIVNSCKFDLTTEYPICNDSSYGNISDINDWDCIYASAYSNNSNTQNYFLKYPSRENLANSTCSVYCRDELTYYYPSTQITALAGNYFTIGERINSYYYYLDNNTTKVSAATLGPVEVTIKRECKILGTPNGACQNSVTTQLNNLEAPDIEFAYESDYYNNPTSNLKSTIVSDNKNTYDRTITYRYFLPSNTYKYVSKTNGVSHKNISTIGGYPYIDIGSHSPIHFTETDDVKYQLTVKKFNLPNFDNLILKGQTMTTKFTTSIETYIKTLMDSGRIKPTYINGLYYLDQTFVKFLSNNGYSANDVINSTCGDTNNYTCYNNANGIYCYDENTYTNSEQTYALFNACINSEVQQLTTTKANYKNDMLYECSFKVEARPVPDDPECTDTDCPLGIDVIFRPISLDNPFPGKDADVDGRETGTNWCYGTDDCSNTNPIVTSVITNNRGVETEAIYKEREPLYIIELNPARIKEIREYNNTTTYDDFNLDCDSDGNNCKSKFIREYDFSNYFNGCGIKNSEIYRTAPQKCNPDDAW